MANPKLEVRLKDKQLFLDGDFMRLDYRLISAETPKISDPSEEIVLTLRYEGKRNEQFELEIERIYELVNKKRYSDRINVSSSGYGLPNVSLVGVMDTSIRD